jgi:hypothetical protein
MKKRGFLLKRPKLNKIRQPALPCSFPGQERVLARTFRVSFDQKYWGSGTPTAAKKQNKA